MNTLSWAMLNPFLAIAKRVWGQRVVVISQSEAANFEVAGTLRWVRPDRVSSLRSEKGYREFVTRNFYKRPTVYRDREGSVLMVKGISGT